MKRRRALRALSTAGAVALAGCLADDVVGGGGDGDGDGNDPAPDDGTPTPAPTDNETPTPAPTDDGTPTPAPTDENAPTDTPTDVHTAATDWGGDTHSPTGTPTGGAHVDTVSGTPPGDGQPSATPSPSPPGTGTDEATATPGPVEHHSFAVTDSGCGTQTDDATVSFGNGVSVSGTIWGSDGCYTARLVAADVSDDELTVAVAAERDAGTATACVQCITAVDYEASFAFVGGTPTTVTVVHVHGDERTRATTARRE